jgi:hypothetical protein
MNISMRQVKRVCEAINHIDGQFGAGHALANPDKIVAEVTWGRSKYSFWPYIREWLQRNRPAHVTMIVAECFKEHGWERKRVCIGSYRQWSYVPGPRACLNDL